MHDQFPSRSPELLRFTLTSTANQDNHYPSTYFNDPHSLGEGKGCIIMPASPQQMEVTMCAAVFVLPNPTPPPMARFWLLGGCNGNVACFDDNDAHGFWETHQQSVLFFFLDVRCIHVSWGWKVTSVQMIPWNQKWMPHPFWSSVALVVCQKLPKSSTSMYSPLYLVCEQPYKLVVPL